VNGTTVLKFDPAGNGSVYADSSDGLTFPYGVAVDPAGDVYVGDYYGTSSVYKFTAPHTGSVFADSGDGLVAPHDIAFGAAGNVYVSDEGNDTVFVFTAPHTGSVFADNTDGLSRHLPDDLWPATVAGNIGVVYRKIVVGHSRICAIVASQRLPTSRQIAFQRIQGTILPARRRTDRAVCRGLVGLRAGCGHVGLGVRSRSRSMRWRIARNSGRGIATSAIWNTTRRA
jgi:hypothetical protein